MQKRSLNLLLLSFVMIMFALGFVSAQTIFSDIADSFRSGVSGVISPGPGFAQFLLFILVALIIYAIAEELPFVGTKTWVAGAIAVVVGLLSTFFLKSEEVYTILLSYGALGITLTAIIPFVIISVIAKKAHDKDNVLLGKLLWITFFVVTLFKWGLSSSSEIGTFGKWVYPIVLSLVLAMLFFENWIYFRLLKLTLKGESEKAKEFNQAQISAEISRLRRDLIDASPKAAEQLRVKIGQLERS